MKNVRAFIALVVAIASVVTVTNAQGQATSLSESVIDFGAVAVGASGNDIVTVTNVSNFDIIISASVGADALANQLQHRLDRLCLVAVRWVI